MKNENQVNNMEMSDSDIGSELWEEDKLETEDKPVEIDVRKILINHKVGEAIKDRGRLRVVIKSNSHDLMDSYEFINVKEEQENEINLNDMVQCVYQEDSEDETVPPIHPRSFEVKKLFKHAKKNSDKLRKYACKFCGQRYLSSGNLGTHITLVHNRMSWAHECNVCKRKFPYLNKLRQHFLTHLNYKCPYCEHVTKQGHFLNSHLKKVHRITNSYSNDMCHFCQAFIPNRMDLVDHIENVHHYDFSYDQEHQTMLC